MFYLERHYLAIGGISSLLILGVIALMITSLPVEAQLQCPPDNKCCLYYNEYLKYKEMLDRCESDPSSCPSNTGWIYQQKIAAYQKFVELLSEGKCGDWSPPQGEVVTQEASGEITTVTQASGGASMSNESGYKGEVSQPVSNGSWEEPVTPADRDSAAEEENVDIEEGDILVGFGVLAGMLITAGLVVRSIVRKLTRDSKEKGGSERKVGGVRHPVEGGNPLDQFTRSFEKSGERLAGNLGKLAVAGAGADAVKEVADSLVDIYLKRMRSAMRRQMEAGGLGRVKPTIVGTLDPKVRIIRYDAGKSRTLLERMRLRTEGKKIVRKLKRVKAISRFTEGLGKGVSGVSKALQVYDTISSYNEYVKRNEKFIKKNPVLGRILGASKAVGEQIINTVLTKNPIVGWADTVVSSFSGGKYSIMRGIKAAEGSIDRVTGNYYETVFRGEAAAHEVDLMSKQHNAIKEHVKKLRDPKFVKKLKARGWTDEQIRKTMIRLLGM